MSQCNSLGMQVVLMFILMEGVTLQEPVSPHRGSRVHHSGSGYRYHVLIHAPDMTAYSYIY